MVKFNSCSIFMPSNNFLRNFFTYMKMSKNSSVKYYQENNERLWKNARDTIEVLFKKTKEKEQKYGRERYKNLLEKEK